MVNRSRLIVTIKQLRSPKEVTNKVKALKKLNCFKPCL